MILTSWSDFHKELDLAPKKHTRKQRIAWILKELRRRPQQRFSIFEIGENFPAARQLTVLFRQGILTEGSREDIFPWTYYTIHPKRTKAPAPKPIGLNDGRVYFEGEE